MRGRKPEELGPILRRAADFEMGVYRSPERQYEAYAKCCDRYSEIAANLKDVAKKHLGVDWEAPKIEIIGMAVASLPRDEAQEQIELAVMNALDDVRGAFVNAGVGTVEWLQGDTCKFEYHDVHRRNGITNNFIHRLPNKHSLVRARIRRLDDRDVELPQGAQAIVDDLLPCLRRELRVILGTQVEKQVGDEEVRTERTALGILADRLKEPAKQAAKVGAVAAGTAAVVSAAAVGGTLAWSALAPVAVMAVADPALVLGDVVLFGWE